MMVYPLCIRIERRIGEQIKRALARLELFDPSRKIMIDDETGMLLIPILKDPDPEQYAGISLIGHIDIIAKALPKSEIPPKSLQETLKDHIPDDLIPTLPKSFDIIGDILILEALPESILQHKGVIANALLSLNSNVRTVLLKVGKVEGKFRVPKYEFLAGVQKWDTIHVEYGVRLKVDVSQVYFSPRLGTEQQRVALQVSQGETVLDMFAGVGPFSIMIAKRVTANIISIDLNPYAIELLNANMKLNRLKGSITPICGDARVASVPFYGKADRVIMNLPGHSMGFLEIASEAIKSNGGMIHFYTFAAEDPLANAEIIFREAAEKYLPYYAVRAKRIVKPTAPREWQVVLDVWASVEKI